MESRPTPICVEIVADRIAPGDTLERAGPIEQTDVKPNRIFARWGRFWQDLQSGPFPFLALLSSCVIFGVLFGYLSYMRFYTFGASVNDLGFWNQVYWTTIHGGVREWIDNSQQNFYSSYPLSSSTFLVFVPAYYVEPAPSTLLVLQACALSSAAIPAYLIVRTYGRSQFVALGVGGLFLLDFQVQGAFLNDFHIECLFPTLFLGAVLLRERRLRWAYPPTAVLAGFVDPLALLVVIAFVFAMFYSEASPRLRPRAFANALIAWLRTHAGDTLVSVALLTMLIFLLTGGYVTAFHLGATNSGGAKSSVSTSQLSAYGLNSRLLFLCLTTAPFLGVVFVRKESLITSVPLIAFLAVGSLTYFEIFGHQTSLIYIPVALWGLALFARGSQPRVWTLSQPGVRVTHVNSTQPEKHGRARSLGWVGSPGVTVLSSLGVTLVLLFAYSPVSPINSHLTELSGVNEVPANILNITPADHFLHAVLGLVPEGASVLTQNNIVQLTGRTTFVWTYPGNVIPNVTSFEYILADDSNNQFAQFWYTFLAPYLVQAFDSGKFGVLAFGLGVTLLERGYSGRPALNQPIFYPAASLPLSSGYRTSSASVHPPANDSAFWYGPYVGLPPGAYNATFSLEVSSNRPESATILQLAVYAVQGAQSTYFNQSNVELGEFPAPNKWTQITLNFTLAAYSPQVQCPGFWPTDSATVSLEGISIELLN
jgi:uncharacterized membrane protein